MGAGIPEKAGTRNEQGEKAAERTTGKNKKSPQEILKAERLYIDLLEDQLRKYREEKEKYETVLQLRQDLIEQIRERYREQAGREADTLREQIGRADHKDIIEMRAAGLPWEDVARASGYCVMQVRRIYDKFLQDNGYK